MRMEKVTVSADALYQILTALNGPGHLIREIQALRGPIVGADNPLNILIAEYNQAVEAFYATPTPEEVAAVLDSFGILRPLLGRCLQVISTLEGEDTTESEMLDSLKADVKSAMGTKPLVPGGLI